MFDDILGKVDLYRTDFISRITKQFKSVFKNNTVRIECIEYCNDDQGVIAHCTGKVFKTGNKEIGPFIINNLMPILQETDKTKIIMRDIDYDAGVLKVKLEWE